MTDESNLLVPLRMPELGTNPETVRVSGWLVEIGQPLIAGERVVQVILPGITCDIPVDRSGVLCSIDRGPGTVIHPGDILGWIRATVESVDEA